MRINAYCRNFGWLFQDLQALYAEAGAIATEEPIPDADAWICIRTNEWEKSPDLTRTVVQIHDHFEHKVSPHVGALVSAHDDALGARRIFICRESMPDRPTVAWVGRPVNWHGSPLRSPEPLVMALIALHQQGFDARLLLIGEGLRPATAIARNAVLDVELHERPPLTIEQYPALYHSADLVVITSRQEAGPMPLYEALACGLPVLSTAVGWAPKLLRGWNGRLYDLEDPDDMLRGLRSILSTRGDLFSRRQEIRDSLGERWLDGPGGWIERTMDLARSVARSAA